MQELTNAVAEPTRLRHFGRAAIAVAGLGVLALVGCAAPASGPVGTWTSSPSASADEAPRLVVGADGSVTGDDGCNALEGRWDPADAQIAFSDVASTLMACDGVDTWLSGLATATVEGDTMTVRDASGAAIGELHRHG
ncbi:MAG TPA: META domain-containing protein [Microbacteriaceae bacterium]|nr:META domain-containing protein [Microbacteriaceae bacterium]